LVSGWLIPTRSANVLTFQAPAQSPLWVNNGPDGGPHPPSALLQASIKRAADWLRAKNIGALVVTSGSAVLGLVSEREIVQAFSRYGETAGSIPVKEVMQYGFTVSPDESVNRVRNLMTHHRVRHILVLRGGELAGIVSIGDVVKHRLEDLELETNVLRDVYNAAR
jgi:CBS domain-containing protein